MRARTVDFPASETADAHNLDITDLTTPNGDTIRALFAQSIRHYRPVFEARRTRLNRDGELIDLGPDYRTRFAGLRRLAHLCTQGRQSLPPPQPKSQTFSLEDLRRVAAEQARPVSEDPTVNPKESQAKAGTTGGPLRKPEPSLTPLRSSSSGPIRICDLTNAHHAEIRELFAFGLRSIDGCFEARKLTLNRDGDIVDLGPDVQAGLAGIELLAQLATQGQEPLPVSREPKPRSNEEVYEILRDLALRSPGETNPVHGNP